MVAQFLERLPALCAKRVLAVQFSFARSPAADGQGLQMWRAPVSVLSKHPRTTNNGRSFRLGLGMELNPYA
jgi:hypothetical protein